MARLVKQHSLLRFRDSESKKETRTEQSEVTSKPADRLVSGNIKTLMPFDRVKSGAGELFLAAEVIPAEKKVN